MFCLEFAILTYTVPREVKTLLIFGLADHFKKLREAFEEFGVISAIVIRLKQKY